MGVHGENVSQVQKKFIMDNIEGFNKNDDQFSPQLQSMNMGNLLHCTYGNIIGDTLYARELLNKN